MRLKETQIIRDNFGALQCLPLAERRKVVNLQLNTWLVSRGVTRDEVFGVFPHEKHKDTTGKTQ